MDHVERLNVEPDQDGAKRFDVGVARAVFGHKCTEAVGCELSLEVGAPGPGVGPRLEGDPVEPLRSTRSSGAGGRVSVVIDKAGGGADGSQTLRGGCSRFAPKSRLLSVFEFGLPCVDARRYVEGLR